MRSNELYGCAILLALVATGCSKSTGSPPPPGALDVVLESDMALPKDIDNVSLEVTQGGQSLVSVDRDEGAGKLLLPATFEVKATSDPHAVTIHAVGYKNHQPRVERDAVTPIPIDHVGELRLALNYLCLGTAQADADGGVGSTCPDGQTCVQGSCATDVVPASAVPVAGSGQQGGSTGGDGGASSKGCFDVAACFASAAAAQVDTSSCVVTLPMDTVPATVNVALQFPAGGAGVCGTTACWIPLTDWTLRGNQLQLPAAACKDAASQGASIVLSTSCNTQSDTMPDCGPWSSVSTPAQQPPASGTPVIACSGSATQSCGMCGTQTRTCTDGNWGAWGPCVGEGACVPGATQSCGSGGTQACSDACQWATCGCPADQLTCGATGDCRSPTDVHSCGSCSDDCTALPGVASASVACSAEKCSYTCSAGLADCAGTGTGCATDLTVPATCGSCSNDCTRLPHVSGSTGCSAGHCTFPTSSCAPGWGDCNGDPSDGCETALDTTAHCGACTTVCSGADALCDTSGSPAKCGSSCAGTVCGAACVNTATDVANCGACGVACGAPTHGQATCASSACGISCNSGYTACGATCVDTTSDANNCGACGHKCASGVACQSGVCPCGGSATQSCTNCGTQTRTCNGDGTWSSWSACTGELACAPMSTQSCEGNGTETCSSACAWGACSCNSGYSLCGTTCVNENADNNNCGSCGNACSGGRTCQSGSCQCPSGGAVCVGACTAACTLTGCSSGGLTWAYTGSGALDWNDASSLCASYGGGWRLPTLDEVDGATSSAPISQSGGLYYLCGNVSLRGIAYYWTSTSYSGTVGGSGPTCSTYYWDLSVSGSNNGVACPNLVQAGAICVQ